MKKTLTHNLNKTALLSSLLLLCLFISFSAKALITPFPFIVCTNYDCKTTEKVTLTKEQWLEVYNLFSAEQTIDQEKQSIRQAIALLETQIGEMTGTWRDKGRNLSGIGKRFQLDCIAESTNTTTYLKLLKEARLLKWHDVGKPDARHRFFLFSHWTAVITERESKTAYAVDSWYLDNGKQPIIQRMDLWMKAKGVKTERTSGS